MRRSAIEALFRLHCNKTDGASISAKLPAEGRARQPDIFEAAIQSGPGSLTDGSAPHADGEPSADRRDTQIS